MPATIFQPQPEIAQAPALLLSAETLSRELGFSIRTVRRLNDEGKLPAPVRIGRAVRWSRQTIERWIAAGSPTRAEWEFIENDN